MAPQLMCRNGIYVDYEKMAAEGVIHPKVGWDKLCTKPFHFCMPLLVLTQLPHFRTWGRKKAMTF